MPIPLIAGRGDDPDASGAAPATSPRNDDQQLKGTLLTSQIGIVRYHWTNGQEEQQLRGDFALPSVYGSRLSLEVADKEQDAAGSFGGRYRVTTYTGLEENPAGVFATGTLLITNLAEQDGDPSDVYEVVWKLDPIDPGRLGYVDGTSMLFKAVGMSAHDQSRLVVAWDNANYARAFTQCGQGFIQYGIHGTQVAVSDPG